MKIGYFPNNIIIIQNIWNIMHIVLKMCMIDSVNNLQASYYTVNDMSWHSENIPIQ